MSAPGTLAPFYEDPFVARDASRRPLPFARLEFFIAGTSVPKAVYADAGLATALGDTLTADANGVFPTYYAVEGEGYKVRLSDADGVQIWIEDMILIPA